MLDQIDFCIKTYLRPQALANLRASIERFYPAAHVTVNSHSELHLGRNELVKTTDRPFLLFLDDDFEFTAETRIDLLLEEMADQVVGIAAGVVQDHEGGVRVERISGGSLRTENRILYINSHYHQPHEGKRRDMVPNFCLIRREVFDSCRWRWGIGAEHADFYMQVKAAGWQVVQRPDVRLDHDIHSPAESGYKGARWNTEKIKENMRRFMDHWRLDQVIVNGKVMCSRQTDVA